MNDWDYQCCASYPDCLHPRQGRGPCDHGDVEETTEARGIAWKCRNCFATGWNSYEAIYGVSDADFI